MPFSFMKKGWPGSVT